VIEQPCLVSRVDGTVAWVHPTAASPCTAGCARGGCGIGALRWIVGRRRTEFAALNAAGARAGERVVVGLPEGALMRGAVLMYLLPLGSAIGLAMVAQAIAPSFTPGFRDGAAMLAGIIGLVAGLASLPRLIARMACDARLKPVVLRLATSPELPLGCVSHIAQLSESRRSANVSIT
jgi:sigma-E factor negative regulatory protein RseC